MRAARAGPRGGSGREARSLRGNGGGARRGQPPAPTPAGLVAFGLMALAAVASSRAARKGTNFEPIRF